MEGKAGTFAESIISHYSETPHMNSNFMFKQFKNILLKTFCTHENYIMF